jgi:carbohydrate-selective porin OprB
VWTNLKAVAIRNWPGAFSVHVDLYTAGGRSTHQVEMTVHEKNGRPVIELDDIVQR